MRRTIPLLAVALALAAAVPARGEDALPPPRPRNGGTAPPPVSPTPRPVPPTTAPGAAAPLPTLATPADYRLAAGDEIEVEVVLPKAIEAETQNPFKEGRRFIVAPGGALSVPHVKDVPLHGRSVAEVRRDVEDRLKADGIAQTLDVFVRVTAYAPRFVWLVGAMFKKIEVSPFRRPNLLTVFAEAGEAMKDIDVGTVVVRSVGRDARRVDFRAVLASGGATDEALLDADDFVVVSKAVRQEAAIPVVYIGGEVRDPGAYPLEAPGGAKRARTVVQLFLDAKGGTQYADLEKVTIRRARGNPPAFRVNLKAIVRGQMEDVPLEADDIVMVPD